MALEQMGAFATRWLSLLCLALSMFGSICALGGAWAARWFVRRPSSVAPATWPDISILKPLSGIEARLSENIETYFDQDYPGDIQYVFGVQDPDDGAIPVIRALMRRYPGLDLHLVVNGAAHGVNRKVSNLINMGQVARHPLIVLADSDVAVSPNYLRTLAAALAEPGVGVVTCLYRGLPNGGFWSRLSAMGIHDHFLPGAAVGLALGLARPCLGQTIALNRETLSWIGGFEAVADELADDYAIARRRAWPASASFCQRCWSRTRLKRNRCAKWCGMNCAGRGRFSPSIRSDMSGAGSPTPCRWR
jgi:ceramide glucosyltransferase